MMNEHSFTCTPGARAHPKSLASQPRLLISFYLTFKIPTSVNSVPVSQTSALFCSSPELKRKTNVSVIEGNLSNTFSEVVREIHNAAKNFLLKFNTKSNWYVLSFFFGLGAEFPALNWTKDDGHVERRGQMRGKLACKVRFQPSHS